MPTVQDALQVHDELIERTGGTTGVLNAGAVASALARAQWGPFRRGGDVAERAALLMRGIVSDHPFADGNKRTAGAVTLMFLHMNGWTWRASAREGTELLLGVARGELTLDEVEEWIRTRLERL